MRCILFIIAGIFFIFTPTPSDREWRDVEGKMNRPTAKLCHIRDCFVDQWSRDYPNVPLPEIHTVCDISLEGDRLRYGSAFGGVFSGVRASLDEVNATVVRLEEELSRQRLIQQFLAQVVNVVSEFEEGIDTRRESDTLLRGDSVNKGAVNGVSCVSSGQYSCDCVAEQDESCSLCAVRGKVSSVKDVFDKLSAESLKFVSKIEVSAGDRACSPREQHSRNSWNSARHDFKDCESNITGNDPNDSSVSASLFSRSNSTPDREMFRKTKAAGGLGHEDDVLRHKVGSKDNFLAISAKHNAAGGEIPRNFDAVNSSPKMSRSFQMLKLTNSYEFVLESDAASPTANTAAVASRGGAEHNSWPQTQGESQRHGSPAGSNSRTDGIASGSAKYNNNRAESANVKKTSSRGGVSIITVENTKKTPSDQQSNSLLENTKITPSDQQSNSPLKNTKKTLSDQQNNTPAVPSDSRPASLEFLKQKEIETNTSANITNTVITQSRPPSVKKAPVPPPVAKKPIKGSNSNQLSPSVTGSPPFSRAGELSPRNSLERKDFPEPAERNDGHTQYTHATENISGSRDNEQERKHGQTTEPVRVTPPSPTVAELKTKYTDRQNSWPGELLDERAKKEASTSGAVDNLVVYREAKSVENLNRPKSEEILGMRPCKPAPRFGVDGLVENVKTSFGLVRAKFQDSEHLPDKNDAVKLVSKRSSTPPVPPPRSSVVPPEIASFGGSCPEVDRPPSGSGSTDTVTDERKMSASSDFDVKEALTTLDTLLASQSTEEINTQISPEDVDTPKPHKFRSNSYEKWTINRVITSSITQGEYDSISDDDELDGTSISPAAASPSLKRHGSPTGSKDSGLCDETTADPSAFTDSVFEADLSSGRIRDLRLIQAMEQREEEASDQCDSMEEPPMKYVDYNDGEAADSDFVYSNHLGLDQHEINRLPSPNPDYGPEENAQSVELDRGSWVMDSSGDDEEGEVEESAPPLDELDSATEGILKMRQLLVKGVLDSEKEYLEMLNILIHYKHSLEASTQTSVPVISKDDVSTIFSNIENIYEIHNEFVKSLMPKVQKWTHDEKIGEIFKEMIYKFIQCGSYLSNYHLAVSTVHKCCSESDRFQELAKEIKISPTLKQTTTLEDALFKPVQRVQRNTLVLHDLIKYTPEGHRDMEELRNALKLSQQLLTQFATEMPVHTTTKENRRLVKSSFLVELVNGIRKLRFMFLFSDIWICTKRVTHRNNKVTFDIKWFTPLNQMTYDTKFGYNDDLKNTIKDDIDELKAKIRTLKKELKLEMKKLDGKDKHRSSGLSGAVPRVIEKLRKKINQQEAQLILACPKLPFKVSLEGGKTYTLLMTTDYEREEWKETLASLMKKTEQQQISINSIFVQELINSVKETPQVNKIGNVLMHSDEDILTGTLNVTIHKMNGLTEDCDSYCCLEMDSFGHFFMKAKTHIASATRDPTWDADFELELEGSQTIRFLCFKKEQRDHGDKLLGRGALELSRHWLKGTFQEKTVVMNEISLVISVRHTVAEKTMSRTPSRTSTAVFGVKISTCARREGKTVPMLVTACLQEVEKRGLDEVGIYRVSGVTSDLQRIKKLFDKNVRAGIASLENADIHAVTGTLKLYLRELPEPLFTEASYHHFVDTLKLSDEEAKAQCMLSLLHQLPDVNYYTIVSLLEHLLKVAKNVTTNKMSVHNLATVFGPTLLAPAAKQDTTDPMELMFKGAEEVMHQSTVINFLLGIAISGRSLRKSAQ